MADRTILETFPNPHPRREYLIEHRVREFTSLCPRTGQPDFARISVDYVAAAACIELKSLKLYLQSFRTQGIFYEDVTNAILDDLVAACQPRWMRVRTRWSVRGGIASVITAEFGSRAREGGLAP
ncbi:MAG: NADPH-dependent 7-cyano-7-deazaguanine reductase QueF [Planctomycetes bacterium]|nr:NADPH-dependent 7-cyano-7-deazaguanine reductase QueF [Planctomycetota bacterium]